ncbi:hypothetical protein KIN20_010996 [Parelaphostrongylus tenuis]|uniref:Uncharacterized protein n=1 Tax=Parelaphostrongylus tenuis TaxID=148309 RepID=A0AAD5QLR8_PARTN|nr:hypothetical protein KIN20_010996 [Parelaphostrongylus tenuis]
MGTRLVWIAALTRLYNTPAPLVIMKSKKVHSNASEELHEILRELAENRQSLRSSESEHASLQRINMKLKADLRMAQDQLRFSTEGKLGLRLQKYNLDKQGMLHFEERHGMQYDVMFTSQVPFDVYSESESNLIDCKKVDVSHQSSTSDELYKKIDCLEYEMERLQSVIESERRSHKANLETVRVAVKAAEKYCEEAKAELKRLIFFFL